MNLVAHHGREIVLRIQNRVGILADIARLLADRGLEQLAVQGTVEGDLAVIRLVTDDNLRACEMLRANRYAPEESSVVLVHLPHKPGMLHRLSERLAGEMIDLHHLYASAMSDQDECLVVLHSNRDEQALVVLNELATVG